MDGAWLLRWSEFGEVGENLGGVTGHITHAVSALNNSGRIDEVRETLRIVRVLMIGGSHDFVGMTDAMVHVGQQRKGEPLRLPKGMVVSRGVERRSKHEAMGIGEIVGPVTQSLALNRSTGCGGFGIPPQQDPVSNLVRQ